MILSLLLALPLMIATLALSWLVFLAFVGIGIRLQKHGHSRGAGDGSPSSAVPDKFDAPAQQQLRFAFVIPAHDEEAGIARSVKAALAVDYPHELLRVIVVADNCSDDTARVALEAGADVLERHDPDRKGKGYALRHAFDHILPDTGHKHSGSLDAVVVVDADSQPCRGLLTGLARRITRGEKAVQVENGILNPDAAPLTWLLHVGNVMENALFHEPKALLGLPTVLRGNGMCITADVLRTNPWQAFTATEDTEYSLNLLEQGIRVRYLADVRVRAESPTSFDQLYTQRLRWAAGNAGLSKTAALRFICLGAARRDAALADAGWSLLVSSRPALLLAVLAPTIVSAVLKMDALVAWGLILLLMQMFLLVAALGLAGLNARRALWTLSLPLVVGQLVFTTVLGMFGFGRRAWVRTRRI